MSKRIIVMGVMEKDISGEGGKVEGMVSKVDERPIGIFDSGVGGVSVLGEMIKVLPGERFIYFADSKNAPYGIKDDETVKKLSMNAADFLLSKGIKALVVACNTATAVAINELRSRLQIPVIGMEPAVKPATELVKEGKILVMATPVTLRQEKFNKLLHRFDEHSQVIPLPCPGLVELVEKGETEGDEVRRYLTRLYEAIPIREIAVVVLGCTHYVFVRQAISEFFSPNVQIIDGNCGTAKYLNKVLLDKGCRNINGSWLSNESEVDTATTQFYTSGRSEHIIPLCRTLLKKLPNCRY